MKKVFTRSVLQLVAAAVLSVAGSASADIVIDTFTADTFTGASRLEDFTTGDGGVGHSTAAAVADTLIIGGFRDVFIEKLVDNNPGLGNGINAAIGGGVFSFGQDPGVGGTAIIRWDGANAALAVDTTGLGGKDLSSGAGFELIYNSTDDGLEVTFEVWDMFGGYGTFSVTTDDGTQAGSDQLYFLPFGIFQAQGVDFTSIGALQATVNSGTPTAVAIDLTVRQAYVPVPEPLSVALVGIGLVGVGFAGRSKAKGQNKS